MPLIADVPPAPPPSLRELQQLSVSSLSGSGAPKVGQGVPIVRLDAIREAATGLGARGGLAWRSSEINAYLLARQDDLDRIYDLPLRSLVRDHFRPPVLAEAGPGAVIADEARVLRTVKHTYRILSPAQYVVTPPSWRQYLLMPYEPPKPLPGILLPRTDEERKIWGEEVARGWERGVWQANRILEQNVARLTRDIRGMALYRKLVLEGVVTPPAESRHRMAVVQGNADELHVGAGVREIHRDARFNVDTSKWLPGILDEGSREPAVLPRHASLSGVPLHDAVEALDDALDAWAEMDRSRMERYWSAGVVRSKLAAARKNGGRILALRAYRKEVEREEADLAVIRYLQYYRTPRYSDRTWKRVTLRRGPGGWRIVKERPISVEVEG